jgi:hypothetical protein
MIDSKHAFDAANDAADRAAHHRTDWASPSAAFMDPVRDAARHALGACSDRYRTCCQDDARYQNICLHGFSLFC